MSINASFAHEPPPSTLDKHGNDRLLDKLIATHGEPRYDIAPELAAARPTPVGRGAYPWRLGPLWNTGATEGP